MRTFEHNSEELNEMVDFIRKTINIPRNGRFSNNFKICIEYLDSGIKVYPTEGSTIYYADIITRKAAELDLELMTQVDYKHEEYVSMIYIY